MEFSHFYSRLAEEISVKPGIQLNVVKSWIRTKISFSLLRTTNLCMRGSRAKLHEAEPYRDTNMRMAATNSLKILSMLN